MVGIIPLSSYYLVSKDIYKYIQLCQLYLFKYVDNYFKNIFGVFWNPMVCYFMH